METKILRRVIPAVRRALLARQRGFRTAPGLVADGRDMGTVIFPDASPKVFLTASAEERAELTRVITELRLSIFDLRSDVMVASGLGAALQDIAGQILRLSAH